MLNTYVIQKATINQLKFLVLPSFFLAVKICHINHTDKVQLFSWLISCHSNIFHQNWMSFSWIFIKTKTKWTEHWVHATVAIWLLWILLLEPAKAKPFLAVGDRGNHHELIIAWAKLLPGFYAHVINVSGHKSQSWQLTYFSPLLFQFFKKLFIDISLLAKHIWLVCTPSLCIPSGKCFFN